MMKPAAAESRNTDHVLGFLTALNDEGKTRSVLERFSRSAALDQKIAAFEASYPGFLIYLLDAFAERDLVVVRFAVDFGSKYAPPAASSALPEVLEAIAIFRVRQGFITEFWLEADVLSQVVAIDGVHGPDPKRLSRALRGREHRAVGQRADTEASRSLVERYLTALNGQSKSPEVIASFASDPALAEHIMAFEAGFPGYNLLPDEVIAAGDRVAVRFHSRQQHKHDFMGVPATGLELSITGIVIYRVEGGKIAEHWLQSDVWTLMQLLRAGPASTKQQFIETKARRALAQA